MVMVCCVVNQCVFQLAALSLMDRVIPFVEDLCEFRQRGGRVQRPTADTVLILDIPSWPYHVQSALRERHPMVSVDVRSCQESLSGFCVVLCLERNVMGPVLATVTIFSAMSAVVAWCLAYS